MYESPFSQMSTILAFGLHSDTTNCKASVDFPNRLSIYTATKEQKQKQQNPIHIESESERVYYC